MKKIYSLLLTAAALLVGMNAWADIHAVLDPVNDDASVQINGGTVMYATHLKEAFDYVDTVANGQASKIVLQNEVTLSTHITMPHAIPQGGILTRAGQNITLDMNGNNINAPKDVTAFRLIKGSLNIIGSGTIKQENTGNKGTLEGMAVITVAGAADKSTANWSVLTIGKDVVVTTVDQTGIFIHDGTTFSEIKEASNDPFRTLEKDLSSKFGYRTFYCKTTGMWPYGTGTVEQMQDSCGTPNFPMACGALYEGKAGMQQGAAFGVKVIIDGTVTAQKRAVQINGTVNQKPSCTENRSKRDTATYKNPPYYQYNYPYVKIGPNAHISADKTGGCTGIYASGYGVFDIAGEVYGATGVYMKAGDVNLQDAYIHSTFTDPVTYSGGGSSGVGKAGGSAIAIESNDSYAGNSGLSVTGDTKVEGGSGYAIHEQTYTEDNGTTTSHVTIEGGTIEGGGKGAIAITDGALPATTIGGGNLDASSVTVTSENDTTTVNISNLFPNDGYHTTEVTVNGSTTIVVSKGAAPTATDWATIVGAQGANMSYNWNAVETNKVIASGQTVTLNELQITGRKGQTDKKVLTIENGGVLEVNHLILNDTAQIVVNAGGKLIVKGTQGIVAGIAENIILESSESAQAIFLFHPGVSSNRHPNATVKLTSKGYCIGGDYDQKVWQRFGVPAYTADVDKGAVTRKSTNKITFNDASWIAAYDYAQDDWITMPDEDVFVPFQCYAASSVATAANHTIYTFTCPLMGNTDFTLPLNANTEWNYYANSYMAPINIRQMLTSFVNSNANVRGTVYVYRSSDNWWDNINLASSYFGAPQTTIDPMQAFIFQKREEGTADAVISYKNHIYNPDPNTTPVAAPARENEVFSAAIIEIAAVDGAKDKLYLVESDKFSADFDNGYDAAKYMNNESFNIFAGEQLGMIATDNLEGTAISMTTKAQTSFTMTFSNVTNMDYAVRDNLTGTETAIVEGAIYMFTTAANANVEGRFEIVPVAKTPTAIENIEENSAVKGIYTITGQFVGNDYHNLPNGVYVVDGKKIVK